MITAQTQKDLIVSLKTPQHEFLADASVSSGGQYSAPNPHDLLEAALAACTIMTVEIYAKRKEWPLESVEAEVKIESENKAETIWSLKVKFNGNLTDEQRERLFDIAHKCPIHRVLNSKNTINSSLS